MNTTASPVAPEITKEQRFDNLYERFYYLFEGCRPKEQGGHFFCIGPGWLSLLEETLEQIDHALKPRERKGSKRFQIGQIKEKFGGLRLYYDYGNSRVDAIVRSAEDKSFTLCEACGSPGTLRERCGWYHTYCEHCGLPAGYV